MAGYRVPKGEKNNKTRKKKNQKKPLKWQYEFGTCCR